MKLSSISKSLLFWCALANISIISFVLAFYNKIPPVIPLWYGKPTGEEQLAAKVYIFIPPAVCMLFIVLDFLLSRLTKDTFLKKSLTGIVVVTTLLSCITVLKIIFLVGSF